MSNKQKPEVHLVKLISGEEYIAGITQTDNEDKLLLHYSWGIKHIPTVTGNGDFVNKPFYFPQYSISEPILEIDRKNILMCSKIQEKKYIDDYLELVRDKGVPESIHDSYILMSAESVEAEENLIGETPSETNNEPTLH